ncbi:MAG TPA: maleylpyruvate isomerase family mycothiol-dependent enzyme [Acidimicrobiia bacterium]|nr:maleylpyruvate isomerase family mycothiol-dependent enzyme [Acidimicrobiia bacterium]
MTTSTSTRNYVSNGCLAEYDAFAALVEGLNESQWSSAARCAGWQARDVAGHVVGLAEDTAAGRPGSRNADEEAASVRGESPAGAAARLRAAIGALRALLDVIDDDAWNGPSGVPDLTLGEGVLTLWYDTYVHADDIRDAIGEPSARGAGLDATIEYLAAQLTARGWRPATLVLDDVQPRDVSGGGAEITGDALQFMLVATGRAEPETMGLEPGISIY